MKDFRKGLRVRQGTGTPGAGFSKGEVDQVVSKRNEAGAQYKAAKKKAAEREATKGFGMRQQGMYTGKADIRGKVIKSLNDRKQKTAEGGNTKKIIESKAPMKDKKEAVLAEARKKIGASEEKRAEFKKRSEETKAKRAEKRGSANKANADAAANAQKQSTTSVGSDNSRTPRYQKQPGMRRVIR